MAPQLTFWFEFASTYSYPAAHQIGQLAHDAGVTVIWKPFLLGPIFADLGWSTSPFNLQPAKGRYMWRDMQRICNAADLDFQQPEAFPQNGLHAARIALALPDGPTRADFVCRVYAAEFAFQQPIGDLKTCADILATMNQDAEVVLANSKDETIKDQLKANTQAARDAGVFGSPSFTCADGELFWGHDRMYEAVAWAARIVKEDK
jgi:2-hydroxychromene-2-carboxylate isomerase